MNNEITQTQNGKDRNSKCHCRSGLKFKHCHGDCTKTDKAQKIANIVMGREICLEQYKRKLITRVQLEEYVAKTEYTIAGIELSVNQAVKNNIIEETEND